MTLLEMDQPLFDSYSAKLILFGEYMVLLGAESLAVPFDKFNMHLLYNQGQSHAALVQFNTYVKQQLNSIHPSLFNRFDLEQFEADLQQGIGVKSSIPMGAGMGSSGALVALLYKKYVKHPAENLSDLKEELAQLESCFHGTSSGIDPLVIYTKSPIHMIEGRPCKIASKLNISNFFIFNSGVDRNTQILVSLFKAKLSKQSFHDAVYQHYLLINNQVIQDLIHGHTNVKLIKEISIWQYENMSEFIPVTLKQVWYAGLSNNSYYLKLCGAGGGGYFMGYSVTSYPNSVEIIQLN